MTTDRQRRPFIRPPRNAQEAAVYTELLERAARQRAEIQQIFLDSGHWNTHVRQSHEAPIDPDPDGQLQKLLDYLAQFTTELM